MGIRFRPTALSAIADVTLLATACGGGESNDSGTGTKTPGATTQTTATATASPRTTMTITATEMKLSLPHQSMAPDTYTFLLDNAETDSSATINDSSLRPR
ncbi:hypothetical protein [Actinomadura sp. 6N118]|uniref:hypothetical protein n=1 Tax=Actinomadura sp. 6N118 TaxID=3375151 RepID=UPI0037A6C378